MRARFLLIALVLIFGFSFGSRALAIVESTSILMNMAPEHPAPNEKVNLSLSSFSENLDTATISWFVNGKVALTGVGKKTFSVNAPEANSELTIIAEITLPNGNQSQVTNVIRPFGLVLLWQAEDSYVPPFYRGKALAPPDSFIKVVAIPEVIVKDGLVFPKSMNYTWEKNFDNAPDGSGFGKDFFEYKNNYLETSDNIGVTAASIDAKYSTLARIDIGMTPPKISFYQKNENLGILWQKTLKDEQAISGNNTIVAAPYFISPKELLSPELNFSWSLNGVPLNFVSYMKNVVSLAVPDGVTGISTLKLNIDSNSKIFENASKEIRLQY